jgi:hypothetical protein
MSMIRVKKNHQVLSSMVDAQVFSPEYGQLVSKTGESRSDG